MTDRAETIGERLRRLRLEQGFSQRELSEPGVSYAYISRIEAGARQPSVKALRKVAPKLGVSVEYLETGLDLSEAQQREMRLVDAELSLRLAPEPAGAEEELRKLLEEAVAVGDGRAATRARVALGKAAVAAGRVAEAVELLEPAAADEHILPSERPDVFFELGRAYALLGRLEDAITVYERCLEDTRAIEPRNVAAEVRYATALSYALADSGEFDRAQEVLGEIIEEEGEGLSEPGTQVKLYWSLARLAGMRGHYPVSLDYARRALALIEATEDTVQLGRAHLMCGVIFVRQGKADEALRHLERSERLLGARPAPNDLASLRTEQAKAAVLLGRGEQAATLAREALGLLGELEPAEQGAAWLALGRALELQDDDGSLEAFRRSTEALQQAGSLTEAAEAFQALGRALRAAGREGEALDALDRAAELGVSSGRSPAGRTS
ncbi:MAG: helix-turn-helix domain-containing protein [Gaiellaceae bacterium]